MCLVILVPIAIACFAHTIPPILKKFRRESKKKNNQMVMIKKPKFGHIPPAPVNLFLDLLKVAPVVSLDEDDNAISHGNLHSTSLNNSPNDAAFEFVEVNVASDTVNTPTAIAFKKTSTNNQLSLPEVIPLSSQLKSTTSNLEKTTLRRCKGVIKNTPKKPKTGLVAKDRPRRASSSASSRAVRYSLRSQRAAPLLDVIIIDDNNDVTNGASQSDAHKYVNEHGVAEIIFVGESSPETIKKSKSGKKNIADGDFDVAKRKKFTKSTEIVSISKSAAKSKLIVARDCSPIMEIDESVQMTSQKQLVSCFISRLRPALLTPVIPPGDYPLCGLRYLENIQGVETVTVASAYRSQELKIASYNVLSHSVMQNTKYLYRHLVGIKRGLWSWEVRMGLIAAELDRLQANVLCLQEVDVTHYHSFYFPFLKNRGYDGIFVARGNAKTDGCAMFYHLNKLKVRKSYNVYYNLGASPMTFDNVGQVVAFDIVGTQSVVCVSNTHILFNQRRGDTKLSQLAFLMGKMHEMEINVRSQLLPREHFVGHFLCGDFNIEPFSPIYKFLIDAKINLTDFSARLLPKSLESLNLVEDTATKARESAVSVNLALMRLTNSCTAQEQNQGLSFLQKDTSACKTLTHTFRFASTYEHISADSKLEVSTYHSDQASALCPDFIFYTVAETKSDDNPISESYIRLRRRLTLPCWSDLHRTCGPMPNDQAGSDHLPLCAEFELLCK